MPLSARELTLVLRARDEASRVMRGLAGNIGHLSTKAEEAARKSYAHGQALATAGIAIAGTGALAIAALNNMADAAIEYNQEAAKTLTQTDNVRLSLEQVKRMGLEAARTLPVAFEEIQPALYDIFSSIDTNAPGAALLLKNIGRAAVGGAVDMETAGRITIAILNAWKMPVQDVTKVNDVMFQLVRKGVGTYDEFGKSLGRAVPSALKAGQSVESLAGMMAFLTRNGLSTAMAATSSARALDALAKPEVTKRLKEMGIAAVDAKGRFRPMADVAEELREKLSKLSPAARASALNALFKGAGGTIQAMRFFNLAVNDSNGLLQTLTANMHDSAGAADEAFKVMANTPQAQIQQFANRWEALKVVIGDHLIPIKLALLKIFGQLMNWFTKLNPNIQKMAVLIGVAAAAFLVISGIIMVVVGGFMMFSAAVALAGFTLGGVVAVVAGVVAAFGLLIAAGVLIYKNWDTIKAKAAEVVGYLQPLWTMAVTAFKSLWENVLGFAKTVWSVIGPGLTEAWNTITSGIQNMINIILPYWNKLVTAVDSFRAAALSIGTGIGEWLGRAFQVLQPIIMAVVGAFQILASIVGTVLHAAFSMIGSVIGNFLQVLGGLIDFIRNVFTGNWSEAWNAVVEILKGMWGMIAAVFTGARDIIWGIVEGFIRGVISFFKNLWHTLVGGSIVPDMINAIIDWFAKMPGRVLAFIVGWVANMIRNFVGLFTSLVARVSAGISQVVTFFSRMPGQVLGAIAMLITALPAKGKEWMYNLLSAIGAGFNFVRTFFVNMPGRILSALGNLGSLLWNAGSQILSGLLNGLKAKWGEVTSFIGGIGDWIASHKGPKQYDLKLLRPAGNWIMDGLRYGLKQGIPELKRTLGGVASVVQSFTPTVQTAMAGNGYNGRGPDDPGNFAPAPGRNVSVVVNTQEIDPVKHAADLGFEIARRGGDY